MIDSLCKKLLAGMPVLLVVVMLSMTLSCQPAAAGVKVYNTTFKYGRDNNSTGNYAGSLKYKGKYYFGALQKRQNYKLSLHKNLVKMAKKRLNIGKRPDGICFGLCLAMALSFNGEVKPKAYVNGKKDISFFRLPGADRFGVSNQLWDAMASFQILQDALASRKYNGHNWKWWTGDFLMVKSRDKEFLSVKDKRFMKRYGRKFIRKIKRRCKKNKVTVMTLFDAGHATLVTGIRETKKNYIIRMYDPNYCGFLGTPKRHPFIKIRKKDFMTTGYTLMKAKIKYSRGKYILRDQKPRRQRIKDYVVILDDKKLLRAYQNIEWGDKYGDGLYARPSVSRPYDARIYNDRGPAEVNGKYVYSRKSFKSGAGITDVLKGIGAGAGENAGQFIDMDNRFFEVESE